MQLLDPSLQPGVYAGPAVVSDFYVTAGDVGVEAILNPTPKEVLEAGRRSHIIIIGYTTRLPRPNPRTLTYAIEWVARDRVIVLCPRLLERLDIEADGEVKYISGKLLRMLGEAVSFGREHRSTIAQNTLVILEKYYRGFLAGLRVMSGALRHLPGYIFFAIDDVLDYLDCMLDEEALLLLARLNQEMITRLAQVVRATSELPLDLPGDGRPHPILDYAVAIARLPPRIPPARVPITQERVANRLREMHPRAFNGNRVVALF